MNKIAVEAGRVTLQAEMVRLFGDPAATEDIPVWLILIDQGHLRVLSDQELQAMLGCDLSSIDIAEIETREERQRVAALRTRLFLTSITPVRRLKIPAGVFEACEEDQDRKHIWVDQSAKSLDVYTVSYRNNLLEKPLRKILPKPSE